METISSHYAQSIQNIGKMHRSCKTAYMVVTYPPLAPANSLSLASVSCVVHRAVGPLPAQLEARRTPLERHCSTKISARPRLRFDTGHGSSSFLHKSRTTRCSRFARSGSQRRSYHSTCKSPWPYNDTDSVNWQTIAEKQSRMLSFLGYPAFDCADFARACRRCSACGVLYEIVFHGRPGTAKAGDHAASPQAAAPWNRLDACTRKRDAPGYRSHRQALRAVSTTAPTAKRAPAFQHEKDDAQGCR